MLEANAVHPGAPQPSDCANQGIELVSPVGQYGKSGSRVAMEVCKQQCNVLKVMGDKEQGCAHRTLTGQSPQSEGPAGRDGLVVIRSASERDFDASIWTSR